jgi:hypothetical protein
MRHFIRIAAALGLVATTATVCAATPAPVERAYLSSKGVDSAPCTLQQPCRYLPAALSVVESGGEIWMLDSANFNSGTVTISHSVSIAAAPGKLASLTSSGASNSAVEISGGAIKVSLRNIIFRKNNGVLDLGAKGIHVTGDGSELIVDESTFGDGLGMGVSVEATNTQVAIYRSNFTGSAIYATSIGLGTPSVNALIDHCNLTGLRGPDANGTAIVAIDSNVVVSHSSISHSSTGIQPLFGATVVLDDDVLAYMDIGIDLSSGDSVAKSAGNNAFQFNISDVTGGSLVPSPRL